MTKHDRVHGDKLVWSTWTFRKVFNLVLTNIINLQTIHWTHGVLDFSNSNKKINKVQSIPWSSCQTFMLHGKQFAKLENR